MEHRALPRHEWHQLYNLSRARELVGLPDIGPDDNFSAALQETIVKLADSYHTEEAVEMLFGAWFSKPHQPPFRYFDRIGFEIFQKLWKSYARGGKNRERVRKLIKEAAKEHHWSDKSETRGCSILVYQDEWLIIHEPVGTKIIHFYSENE